MNLNAEMIEKAKAAKSAEELLATAKENGIDMTADEAKTYFAQLNPKFGELDDDDLDNVAGGACGNKGVDVKDITGKEDWFHGCFKCGKCGSTSWTTDISQFSATGSPGYHLNYTPRYCAQCNKRARCMSCAYFEKRDGKSWCNNPNRL